MPGLASRRLLCHMFVTNINKEVRTFLTRATAYDISLHDRSSRREPHYRAAQPCRRTLRRRQSRVLATENHGYSIENNQKVVYRSRTSWTEHATHSTSGEAANIKGSLEATDNHKSYSKKVTTDV